LAEARTHLQAVTNSMYADLKDKLLRNIDAAEGKAGGTTNSPAASPGADNKATGGDSVKPANNEPKDSAQKAQPTEK
jgi:hypothetical protein